MRGYKVFSIVSIIALTAVMISSVVYSSYEAKEANNYKTAVQNGYERSFNDLKYAVSNVNLNLSKFGVVKSGSEQAAYLGKVVRYSEMAANRVSDFSGDNGAFEGLRKFFSQTADYCETAMRTLFSGAALNSETAETIESFRTECAKIEQKINGVYADGTNSIYESILDIDSDISAVFSELESATVEYPSLIYDGPFSDSLANPEIKGVDGEEYDPEGAAERVKTLFGVDSVELVTDSEGKMPAYFFSFEKDGKYSLQVTKTGCHIVQFTVEKQRDESVLDADRCAEIGTEFLRELGYENMTSVWASDYEGIMYINYCTKIDDVIIYPEMIKLKISADDGTVVGMECLNYLQNHTVRDVTANRPDISGAVAAVSESLTVQYANYALIPLNTKEVMTVEVCAKRGEDIYFVYFDKDLTEVNVLMVVDSEQGRLLK